MNDATRDRIASGLADALFNALGYHREGCDCGQNHDGRVFDGQGLVHSASGQAVPLELYQATKGAIFADLAKRRAPYEKRLTALLHDVWGQERAIVIANLKRLKGKGAATRYMEDPGKFWAGRNQARVALDRERADAPLRAKLEITEALRKDAILLKTGKVTAKASPLIDSILYPKRKFVELLSAASRDLFTALVLAEGDRAMETLGVDVAFDVTNPHVTRWLEDYTIQLSENLEAVNEETLRAVLSEGMEAGETIPELMARVNDTFETWNRDRAEVIARTETIRASNEATMESYRQSGVVEKKAWLASPESCEICLALESEEPVALDEPFFDDGYSDGMAPPRHPNCTCAVVAHFDN